MHSDIGASAIAAISVISSGLIAGQMLAIAIANHAARKMPEMSWTSRFQIENELFSKTMPVSLLLPLASLVWTAFLTGSTQRILFSVAGALELIVLVITMVVNIPINRQVASWTAGSAPATWTAARTWWLRFHWLRTVVGAASFVCSAIALGIHL